MDKVFGIISDAELKGLIPKSPSIYRVSQLVKNEMLDRKEKKGDTLLNDKTIHKYAKMWLILFRVNPEDRTENEVKFLSKHNAAVKACNALMEATFRLGERHSPIYCKKRGTRHFICHTAQAYRCFIWPH